MSTTQYLAGAAAIAVPLLYVAAQKFSQVDVPEPEPKKKKESKSVKKAAQAERAAAAIAANEAKEAAKEAAAERKRERERAKKAAKRAAKAAAEAEAAAAPAAEDPAPATEEGGKKAKKKKKKAKKPKKEETGEEDVEIKAAAAAGIIDDWTEVKSTKPKKTVADAEDEDGEVHHVEVDVDQAHFKIIIGKGGATLNAIRNATSTEIDIPKAGAMRRTILVSGSLNGCAQAKTAILQLVKKGYSDLTDGDKTDASVEVVAKNRSSVIGPGGSYIRQIQDRTDTKINMPDRDSTSNQVKVVGSPEGVKMAIAAIKELMTVGISTITHPGQTVQSISVPRSMASVLIGEKGSKIRRLQEATNTKINTTNTGDSMTVTITGSLECIAEARKIIESLMVIPEPVSLGPEWSQQATAPLQEVW